MLNSNINKIKLAVIFGGDSSEHEVSCMSAFSVIKNADADQKFIAHCHESEKQFLASSIKPGKKVLVMIGPEGDFSEEEVQIALKAGFVPVSLGESRLRVETAALVACHTVSLMNDLSQSTK